MTLWLQWLEADLTRAIQWRRRRVTFLSRQFPPCDPAFLEGRRVALRQLEYQLAELRMELAGSQMAP